MKWHPFPSCHFLLWVCVCVLSQGLNNLHWTETTPKRESHYLIFYLKIEFHYFLSLHFYTCQCARVALMRALTLTGWSYTFIHQTTIASGHWGDINWETVSRKPDNPALVLHTTMAAQVKHRFRSFKVKAIGLTMYIMRFTVSSAILVRVVASWSEAESHPGQSVSQCQRCLNAEPNIDWR